MAEDLPHVAHVAALFDAKTDLTLNQYLHKHKYSIQHPDEYWGKAAMEHLDWFRPFDSVLEGTFEFGDIRWFSGGLLNLSYNAIDRHIASNGDQLAILWEGDEPSDIRRFTYRELLRKVCQIANALKAQGVRRGDVVTVYMP